MKNSFTVSPMSQKIKLTPGETFKGSILVANPAAATEDFYYKVAVYPFSITGDDYETDFETMSDWSRMVDWLELEDDEGVLSPNDMKQINFTIAVPENAPGGGQYVMLGVSSNPPSEDTSSVQDIYEMASLIYAEVEGEVKHAGKIIENNVPGFVMSGVPKASTKLENTGNVHETAEVAIQIKNTLTGETIYPQNEEKNTYEVVVMPESTRISSINLANLPVIGVVEVTEEVNYAGENLSTTTTMVICPIWFILLIFATIMSIMGMVFYAKHLKRKQWNKIEGEAQ